MSDLQTEYRCPGIRPGAARPRHNRACCASFAALGPDQRTARGVFQTATVPVVDERPKPPEPETITVAQLAQLVAELQRRAEQDCYTGEPRPTSIWLEIAADESFAEAMALIELGQPYGLVAGYRRLSQAREAA